MAEHNDLGKIGEQMAVDFLAKKGFAIVDQNYRYLKGEIDIIAEIEGFVVFVEVKTRQSKELLAPEKSVSPRKQKLIIKTAHQYIIDNDIDLEARFDIIGIITNQYETEIDHIEDAFYPTL